MSYFDTRRQGREFGMARGRVTKKTSRKRLLIDKYHTQGMTAIEISKKMKISLRTVQRYVTTLTEELELEPQYSEERIQNRKAVIEKAWKFIDDITRDMESARLGTETVEESGKPMKKEEVKEIQDPKELLDVVLGEAKSVQFTKKLYGPDWRALAQLHKVRLDKLAFIAKVWGLLIERETQITTETEREVKGVMYLPTESKDKEEWMDLVEDHKKGKVIGILPPPEKKEGEES